CGDGPGTSIRKIVPAAERRAVLRLVRDVGAHRPLPRFRFFLLWHRNDSESTGFAGGSGGSARSMLADPRPRARGSLGGRERVVDARNPPRGPPAPASRLRRGANPPLRLLGGRLGLLRGDTGLLSAGPRPRPLAPVPPRLLKGLGEDYYLFRQ